MKSAFIYSDELSRFDYGAQHPLKVFRLKLTYELIKSYGLLSLPNVTYVEARRATDEELLSFHSSDYVDILKAANAGRYLPGSDVFGLGPGDNPVFSGLLEWSRLVTGASLQAAALVDDGTVNVAFNISGGLHHALSSMASGFCYINDPVIAILSLLRRGRRVVYIDLDAHHGDGVQEAFYNTDRVLTISLHESGKALFPGSGFEDEIGIGKGEGYAVNVPLPPYADDELFVHAFNEIVPPLVARFRPDIVVSQLGVDSLRDDPLTHLNYTNNGFSDVVKMMKELSPKWVALGGGGYNIENVAKAWTLAWATMNGETIPDELPHDFLRRYSEYGFESMKIRDEPHTVTGSQKERMREEVQRSLTLVKEKVFSKVHSA